jgi:hypothetical protein
MRTDEFPDRELQDRPFGRRGGFRAAALAAPSTLADDIRLFALTFVGGFLFITIFIA